MGRGERGSEGGLSKEGKRKRGKLTTKYPKMITKLSLINKGESSRGSKNMISTREKAVCPTNGLCRFYLLVG